MAGSTVRLNGNLGNSGITGGTLRSIGDGTVEILSSGIKNLRIEGTVKATGAWTVDGVITNTGLIRNNSHDDTCGRHHLLWRRNPPDE